MTRLTKHLLFIIKFFLIVICIINFSVNTYAQKKNLRKTIRTMARIRTLPEANLFLKGEPDLNASILSINSLTDTSKFAKMLISTNINELVTVRVNDSILTLLRPIEWQSAVFHRVSYIYLDNSKYSKNSIDSLRSLILNRLKHGEKFGDLARQFSMDGNSKNGGDTGWFEDGNMNHEFQNAIDNHKKDQIFNVDIPEEKWFYIVKKTHDSTTEKVLRVLGVNVWSRRF